MPCVEGDRCLSYAVTNQGTVWGHQKLERFFLRAFEGRTALLIPWFHPSGLRICETTFPLLNLTQVLAICYGNSKIWTYPWSIINSTGKRRKKEKKLFLGFFLSLFFLFTPFPVAKMKIGLSSPEKKSPSGQTGSIWIHDLR